MKVCLKVVIQDTVKFPMLHSKLSNLHIPITLFDIFKIMWKVALDTQSILNLQENLSKNWNPSNH